MAKYTAEPIPQDTLSALLTKNWISFKEMPRPEIVVANDPEDAISRFNTGDGDYIIISQGGPEIIKYRGNVQYYDRAFPLTAELYSKKDRQRIRDMWWQFKGIKFYADQDKKFLNHQIKSYIDFKNQGVFDPYLDEDRGDKYLLSSGGGSNAESSETGCLPT